MNKSSWLASIAGCLLLAVLVSCAEGGAPMNNAPLSTVSQSLDEGSATSVPQQELENVARQDAESEVTPSSPQEPSAGKVIFDLTPPARLDDPLAYQIIGRARLDLAQRLSVEVKEIQLVAATAVTWPDASLGCPSPGKVFPSIITPGYRIVLKFANKIYEYHTDKQQNMIYCEPQEGMLSQDPAQADAIARAKLDLAQRLGVSVETITVSLVIGGEFSNEAFYCQAAKERTARDVSPVVIMGQRILLTAGGRKYEYHASDQQVIFCRQLK
jgi:hypothetical protein